MTVGRFYARHRRAWTPRIWPMLVLSGGVAFAVNYAVAPGVIGAAAIGVGVGGGLGAARWEFWKWRHPVISHAEFITDLTRDMRESARWN